MMRSNHTKSDNLESDSTEILETASCGVERNGESIWAEQRKRMKVPKSGQGFL